MKHPGESLGAFFMSVRSIQFGIEVGCGGREGRRWGPRMPDYRAIGHDLAVWYPTLLFVRRGGDDMFPAHTLSSMTAEVDETLGEFVSDIEVPTGDAGFYIPGGPSRSRTVTLESAQWSKLVGTTGLSATPRRPACAVTGVRLVVPNHAQGLPVLRALSLCTCCRHYPGAATGGTALLIRPVMSAFPGRVAGSACASSFSRLTQRSLALRPAHSRCHQFVARLSEGFRHFVTSMPAPVASGWSVRRVGLAPARKRRLFTAHTHQRHS
jgi:hypothetical protein